MKTQCIAINRFGKFISDIKTKKTEKVAEKEIGWSMGISKDKRYYYYADLGNKGLTRVRLDGSEPDQEIYFDGIFQNATFDVEDLNPDGTQILLSVRVGSGQEIYKLNNVFN